jgi:hypothetical protein
VTVSFTVTDPAAESADPITGTINRGDGSAAQAISGRTIAKSNNYVSGGPYTINVSVNDGDGGTATAMGTFSLLYTTSGILQPINADKSSNFKLGSTFPIKIKITDCNGASVTTLKPDIGLKKIGTGNGTANEADVQSVPDDGSEMRYDPTAQQYIYNLSTRLSKLINPAGAPLELGSYEVRVVDPTIATAYGYFDIVK